MHSVNNKSNSKNSGLFEGQQAAYGTDIGLVHQVGVLQVTFLLGGLLGQDVTLERMFSLDFTCSGKGEPLF